MAAPRAQPEFVITETMRSGDTVTQVFQRIAATLSARRARLLSIMIYGQIEAARDIDRAMEAALGHTDWPVTWVQGASCDGRPLAGVQVYAIGERPIIRIRLGRRVVGTVYEDGGARFCLLGGIGPNAVSLEKPAQVQQMFGNLEAALELAGFQFSDLIRTWFYNDDILAWYNDFNRVRNEYYSTVKFRTGSLPVSTGVAAENPAGAALTVAAWAMRPCGSPSRAFAVGSPLQCPAPAYGSAFSRAMVVEVGDTRRLLISGTASIFPDGRSAWQDNAQKQVSFTMEVIAAILQSRGMTFTDITRATAYFQNPTVKPYFDAWCAERELKAMPVVPVWCDICRSDLLFELELDASVTVE